MILGRLEKYLLFIVYFSIVGLLVIKLNLGYIQSLLLYFVIPSIYVSYKNTHSIKKSILYALIFGISTTFVFDYIAHVSNVWYVPSETGIRVFNSFPLEEILWAIFYFYIMIISYETFFVKNKVSKIFNKKTKYLIEIVLVLLTTFFSILFLKKELLIINTFYLYLVIFMIATPLIVLIFKPNYVKKIAPMFILFLIPFFIYEYTALVTEQWFFYGQHYIGMINFFGKTIPTEELLFLLFSTPGTVCLYELCN